MRRSKAPYGEIPQWIANDRKVFDRQNYRLIGRMWTRFNARQNAPILGLWVVFTQTDQQLWLPLGECGIDRWFVRAVNASVWYASTNNGQSVVSNLQKKFAEEPTVSEVKQWFSEKESGVVNQIVHECTSACQEEDYHVWYGLGKFFRTDIPVPEETASVFYITMAWLCSEEGRYFLGRYQKAFSRLVEFRDIQTKNIQRRSKKHSRSSA